MLSMQDRAGAIQAALTAIYYLIWVRDGTIISTYTALAGDTRFIEKWTPFLLSNPNIITDEEPKGYAWLQIPGTVHTKWQEDGIFYAVHSAYTHWKTTVKDNYIKVFVP